MPSRAKRRSTARRASAQTAAPGLWRRRKWWFLGGASAAGMTLLVALTLALSGPEATELTVELGAAPDVVLATLDGDFRVSENRGEVLLLYFSFPG